jgi:dienelactone hydrolase
MAMPLESDPPAPCVIFLHGIGQSKSFLDEISQPFVDEGFAMVTFDQYTRGERDVELPWWREASAFRQRAALTVLETRRLVDFLETRNDIDKKRIYLVGASYGAITGATAVAMETRIKAAVMVYGGGDLPLLLAGDAITQEFETGNLGFLRGPITALTAWYLAPSDPVLYVGNVAPRPLLFQNGTRDQLIPTDAAQAFFDAANEPKEQRWYEGDHIGLDEDTVRQVLDEALEWVKQQDAVHNGVVLKSR